MENSLSKNFGLNFTETIKIANNNFKYTDVTILVSNYCSIVVENF